MEIAALIAIILALPTAVFVRVRQERDERRKLLAHGQPEKADEPNGPFERALEACGFRIFRHMRWKDGSFDEGSITIGERRFTGPTQEIHGWKIAYRLPQHASCCSAYTWWRLAQPAYHQEVLSETAGNKSVHIRKDAGLGPRVCAKCGRIERDYDGSPEGIGALVGSSLNIFPVLDGLTRRSGASADLARLALLRQEHGTLMERQAVVELEIAQLSVRHPEPPGDGPYRRLPSAQLDDPPDDRAKAMPALTGGQ